MLLTECQKLAVTPSPSPERLGQEGQATTMEHVQSSRPAGVPGSHTPGSRTLVPTAAQPCLRVSLPGGVWS